MSWAASLEGMRLSVCDESFGATRRTRVPSSLRHAVGCACLRRDTSNALQACSRLVVPYLHAAECTHAAYKPLFFSLVRRMIATLINCVAEKTNAHSGAIFSVAFSPDGTKIVSGSADGTIKVWDIINWSRKDHLMFNVATQRFVLLLLWLNKYSMKFPDDVLDLLIVACLQCR